MMVGVLALLAWFASGDVRRWRTMIYVLIGGFALDVLGLGLLEGEVGAFVVAVLRDMSFRTGATLTCCNSSFSPWYPGF